MSRSVFFVVWGCFVLLEAPAERAPCVVMTPSSVVVQYGDGFTVDCNGTSDMIEGAGWESDYKGTGLINASYVQLKIEKVDRWAIMSQCYMNFIDDTPQCIEILPITVYKLPDTVSILPINGKEPLRENEEYNLTCHIQKVAPVKSVVITWYKDNKRISEERNKSESVPEPQNLTSAFLLRATKSDNGGKFMCEATFDFGPSGPNLQPVRSPPVDIRVLYKPVFEESKVELIEVPANRKITLDCTAQGNPTPQYLWKVPQPTQQRVGSEPILDLKGPFPGTYNCTAVNSQGSSIKQFVITDAPRDYTVLAAVVGVTAALGVLLLISGPFIVTKDGTFSLNKGVCSKGQPSQPI